MGEKTLSLCDENVYSGVFKSYSETLYKYLFFKCGNENLAKDITQESFLRLWKNCGSVIYDTAKGYVFKTANNLLLNEFDKQKVRFRFQQQKPKVVTHENPEFLMQEKELQTQLENAIADLPEKQRAVFLMSRVEKKTYAEIAELLGISKQAVEKRIYKALDVLRKYFTHLR